MIMDDADVLVVDTLELEHIDWSISVHMSYLAWTHARPCCGYSSLQLEKLFFYSPRCAMHILALCVQPHRFAYPVSLCMAFNLLPIEIFHLLRYIAHIASACPLWILSTYSTLIVVDTACCWTRAAQKGLDVHMSLSWALFTSTRAKKITLHYREN
jgi:hypothetical protein